ncbi:MAG: hypothetical protein KDD50_00055 [Bdellovibrionales bacterium]|nr:hypothetical protein [Bdellovibrionales bacterium]
MNKLAIVFIIFFCSHGRAKIYFPDNTINEDAFEYLMQEKLDGVSLKAYLIKNRTNNKNSELVKIYLQAKNALLQKNNQEAIFFLSKIDEVSLKQNWGIAEQKIIFQSLIDLAILQPHLKKSYMLKAINFDLNRQLEPLLRNSPLQKAYFETKASSIKLSWQIPQSLKYSSVFINGKEITHSSITLYSSEIRVCIYSNKFFPQEFITHPSKLDQILTLLPIENNIEGLHDLIPAVFSEGLFFISEKNESYPVVMPPKAILTQPKPPSMKEKISPYLWWGLIGVGALIYYQQNNKGSTSVEPNVSVGF